MRVERVNRILAPTCAGFEMEQLVATTVEFVLLHSLPEFAQALAPPYHAASEDLSRFHEREQWGTNNLYVFRTRVDQNSYM